MVLNKLKLLLFADDTNAFMSGRDPEQLAREMNVEISLITDWLRANHLSLNVSKTHFLLIKPKKPKQLCPPKNLDK